MDTKTPERITDTIRNTIHEGVDRARDATESPRERLTEDYAALRSHFFKLRDDLTRLISTSFTAGKDGAEAVGEVAGEKASYAYDNAKNYAQDVRDSGQNAVDQVTDKIRANPATSALVAFGLGYIASRLFRNR